MSRPLSNRLKRLEKKQGGEKPRFLDIAFVGAVENETDMEAMQFYIANPNYLPAVPECYMVIRRVDEEKFSTTLYNLQFEQIEPPSICVQELLYDDQYKALINAFKGIILRKDRA